MDIVLDIWGDYACFSRPEAKVERMSYPVPTPSAIRGFLNAIYSKPPEFYWQVRRIEVMRPIRFISFKRNEVKGKLGRTPIDVEDDRTQRQTVALKDVRYRVSAAIMRRPGCKNGQAALESQALRRIETGKCFYQPSLGLREFVGYFAPADLTATPIPMDMDLGVMLYDVFDLDRFEVEERCTPYVTLFRAKMARGVVEVPEFHDAAVLRPERR
jgi:CRISPR-associated protein Cas5d